MVEQLLDPRDVCAHHVRVVAKRFAQGMCADSVLYADGSGRPVENFPRLDPLERTTLL